MTRQQMTVEDLCVRRGNRDVLRGLSMHLEVGEVLGVLGPNGAGKSSFLGACCAELPVRQGQVSFSGLDTRRTDPLTLARTRAVLPQQSAMTFDLPVSEVIAMGAYPFPEVAPETVQSWIDEAIERADLGQKASQSFRALSGGEQQRVQFARVLVQTRAIASLRGHAYLFLDEPTASLDPRHQVLLMQGVHDLARKESTAVIIVLHDLNMAARWCDRLMLIADGRVAAIDKPEVVLAEELLEKVYGLPMKVRQHPVYSERLIVMADG